MKYFDMISQHGLSSIRLGLAMVFRGNVSFTLYVVAPFLPLILCVPLSEVPPLQAASVQLSGVSQEDTEDDGAKYAKHSLASVLKELQPNALWLVVQP